MAPLLLALDLGTTSTRALVVTPEGAVRGRAAVPLATRYPAPGRVEQDAEALLAHSVTALRAALAEARCQAADVAALGIVTQRATVVFWDGETGRALTPAIGWQDRRSAPRVAELVARGIPITTLPSATKLEWAVRHDPAVAAAARAGTLRVGTPDAWLGFRLSGGAAHVTDPGQASCTGLYDLERGDWSEGALSLFGVEREWLPQVVPTDAVVDETPAALLGACVPLAARAGDQQAACFAHGTHAPGEAKLTLGTAAMLDVHTGSTPAHPPRGTFPLALWRLSDGTQAFCLEGTVVTAGAAVDWLVQLGLLSHASELDTLAASVGSTQGVAFVPALEGLGTPFLDDGARGLLGGLTRGARAGHVARAVVEGLAQRCADLCEALGPAAPLRVDGGLARSDALLQAIADATGAEVARAFETESTAIGAAWLAGLGAGVIAGTAACRQARPQRAAFAPRVGDEARAEVRRRWQRIAARAAGGVAPRGDGRAARAMPPDHEDARR